MIVTGYADKTDAEVMEEARQNVVRLLDDAQRILDAGGDIEEIIASTGLPREMTRVAAEDLREIGRVDYLGVRVWVMRSKPKPEMFYLLSVGSRAVLRQRGWAILDGLVKDSKRAN